MIVIKINSRNYGPEYFSIYLDDFTTSDKYNDIKDVPSKGRHEQNILIVISYLKRNQDNIVKGRDEFEEFRNKNIEYFV